MPRTKKFKPDPAQAIGSFSKNLLGLKFMQRAKKEVEKIKEEKDESFDISLCEAIKNKQRYIINPSYQFCEKLGLGRLSFKGMNIEIEKMMYNKTNKRQSPPSSSSSSSDNEIDNPKSDDNEEVNEDEDESLVLG